jgi:hypothetical protein
LPTIVLSACCFDGNIRICVLLNSCIVCCKLFLLPHITFVLALGTGKQGEVEEVCGAQETRGGKERYRDKYILGSEKDK